MMDIGSDKKPLNRFDDKDREQADKIFGKGKWVEHVCNHNGRVGWVIHHKDYHDKDL